MWIADRTGKLSVFQQEAKSYAGGRGGVEEAVTGEKETYVIPQSIKKKKKSKFLATLRASLFICDREMCKS